MTVAYTITPQQDRLTVLVLLAGPEPPRDVLHLDVTLDGDEQAVPVAKADVAEWRTTAPQSPSAARRWHEIRDPVVAVEEPRPSPNVSFNVKTHTGFSRALGRLKRGKTVVSQLANNTQAVVLRRDRKPLRYRDSARRHPRIDGDGRLTYTDGTQLFPPVNDREQAVPKVECSGLGALDLGLDGEHPVVRYRAELDNSCMSDIVPRRVDITLRWSGTRWVD